MAFWHRKKAAEETRTSAESAELRESIESPAVPISSAAILDFLGGSGESAAGVNVTVESALSVPAVWAAVNFIAGTLASLPLNVFKKTEAGREKVTDGLAIILHDAVTDDCSSYEWRKYSFEQTLTGGRQVSFIEKNVAGRIINVWPLNPNDVTVKRSGGRKIYELRQGGRTITYKSSEIIDIPFMLKADMLTARSPILTNKDTIGLAIAATNYGSRFFQGGGIPPAVLEGPFQSGDALKRASKDMQDAVKTAYKEKRPIVAVPTGHQIKAIGVDPEKSQLVELKAALVVDIARIYSLPPAFLQDLTNGTFSNVEQQDLQLVKHCIMHWVKQAEQEMNLKLFGRNNNQQYVEFNLDGLLRGDFTSRMNGYAKAIQNAILKPNEVRRQENREDDPEGDVLLIQGATVPLGSQPTTQPIAPPAPKENEDDA